MLQRIGHLENSQNIKLYFQKINCQTSFGEMDYFRFNNFFKFVIVLIYKSQDDFNNYLYFCFVFKHVFLDL